MVFVVVCGVDWPGITSEFNKSDELLLNELYENTHKTHNGKKD
jgi:hypothetical protein